MAWDLITAAMSGDAALARALLAKGADINATDDLGGGHTALIRAAGNGRSEVVRVLIANGANVNPESRSSAVQTA